MTVKKDQDAAVEAAFVDGTLPEADRRAPEVAPLASPVESPLPPLPEVDHRGAEVDRLLELAENETGYAQKQAIVDLRKFLGRAVPRQGPALIDRGPFQGRTPEEIAAGVQAGERPSNFERPV
jgi:hypothetical protein